MIGKEEHPL
jgi:NADPH-dependent 2,4-dienoyl-CoA reductase/sulfur reductase-like enzyme